MSRPKIPDVSWRQCRIAAALFLAGLLTTAALTPQADADDDRSTREHTVLTPTMTPLRDILNGDPAGLAASLHLQAQAQAEAHRQAVAEAAAKRRAQQAKAAAQHRAEQRAAAKRRAAEQAAAKTEHTAPERSSRTQRRSSPPAQAATVSGARAVARSQLSSAQYQCLSNLVSRESGWNHRASNPSSGAYGLFQALPGSKMASAGSDWQSNPLTQMRWGLSYVKSRYGTPCGAWNFWQKNGWY
ncbi:lytic transglycosylase domain-containing protein [Streptomyces sp. NPDC058257]|uniref:aggregation-promoting factor C-terminal-like domain-containing protein n=1 Tax=Streptomyces sp. NPDC058257 TaxID=3346409 RepID=UPI0036EF3610